MSVGEVRGKILKIQSVKFSITEIARQCLDQRQKAAGGWKGSPDRCRREGWSLRSLPRLPHPHFASPGLAAQALMCPPKRQLQPERYVKYRPKIIGKMVTLIVMNTNLILLY